jgi:hypothetical protein
MNVVGCILGTPGRSDTYETAYPASADNILRIIWRLGYGGPSWAGDTNVKATLLRHRNYDYVTKNTDNDSRITVANLPPSLYLASKPAWWGNTPWPPIGPDVSGMVNKIPAQERYEASLSTGVEVHPRSSGSLPAEFQLFQNYPNPFNPATKIQFTIVDRQLTIVNVYDLMGREVATLVNEVKEPGTYTVKFDGSNLASGVYLYRLTARQTDGGQVGSFVQSRILLLLR